MSELRLPIARKQHDLVAQLITAKLQAERALELACNTIMAGHDDEPAQASLVGVDVKDGVYALVLTVPDAPAKPAKAKKEAAP